MIQEQLITKAILSNLSVAQESDGKWSIKTSLKDQEILLKEQKFNQWLLVSNKTPIAKLQSHDILFFLRVLKKLNQTLHRH